jgi:hypothetical protein
MRNSSLKLIAIIIVIPLTLTSCMTTVAIHRPFDAPDRIERGQTITIFTKEGEVILFKISRISDGKFISNEREIAFEDVQRIEIKQVNTWIMVIGAASIYALFIGVL